MSPAASRRRLRKSHSAVELRWGSGRSDSSDENEGGSNDVEKGLLFSPKEYIKNMWKDFKVSPHNHHLSSSSLHSLPADQRPQKRRGHKDRPQESRKHRVTVPKPFHMTLREAERQKHGMKTRSEVEVENAELRRQLEELTECQRQFRASPVPAHVHLPLYEELQERNEERRRAAREQEQQQQHLRAGRKPFSFLERERLKKEQKQQRQQPPDQEKVKPFKAKPVPKSVYAAASGEQMKEEQLYRSIKIQMRAEEMLHSASMPPSMLSRRLSERKKTKRGATGEDGFSYKPQINKEVPDFNATYKRFQKQLEKRKEVKPTTACEPFELRTSHILSHRERILADIEKDRSSPRMLRWPCSPGPARTPNSSLCSSLSGSMEVLPAKVTDATKKRHEAVRKVLEQRKKAEEEEERWKEKQRQREKKLQTVVLKRAQANDPHLALSQTQNSKLKEFRKQDFQRRKEYQQEIQEMRARVKGRPLLLEQVAQRNAKQAAEKRYIEALHGCDVTEDFISSKAAASGSNRKTSPSGTNNQSVLEEVEYEPVLYKKVFLDDEDTDEPAERAGGREEEEEDDKASSNQEDEEDTRGHHAEDVDPQYSDESYSDDDEIYSGDSERETDTKQQEAGE